MANLNATGSCLGKYGAVLAYCNTNHKCPGNKYSRRSRLDISLCKSSTLIGLECWVIERLEIIEFSVHLETETLFLPQFGGNEVLMLITWELYQLFNLTGF